MKTSVLTKSLQSKLWIAFLVSFVGLSACSSETEEPTAPTESSEMTPVPMPTETDTEEQATALADETEDTAYYSGSGNAEDDEKADDTVYVNENNSNLDKTAADGLQ